MLKFLFSNETKVDVSSAFFAKIVREFEKILSRRLMKIVGREKAEISLILVGDKKIHELNRKYRMNKPTDVLSFAYWEGKGKGAHENKRGVCLLGDIFISVDTAKRQARGHKHSLKKELTILFIHGLLHLAGFDHGNDAEEKEMEKWAKKILAL